MIKQYCQQKVLISKALIDSNIIYDEFISINSMKKEYDNMKEEIYYRKTSLVK